MSLLGIIASETLCVRAAASNGSGWGFVVTDRAEMWRVGVSRGPRGMVAVARSPEGWGLMSSQTSETAAEEQHHGPIVIGATDSPRGPSSVRMSKPSVFAYEGTMEDARALQQALDPAWAVSPALRTPADVIFAHVASYMAAIGALYASDVALAHATRGLWRARHLGTAAFLYSEGSSLYAYSVGVPLVLVTVAGAIVVGTPDAFAEGHRAHAIPDGAVVSASRRPHLGWSTAIVAGD